MQPDRRDNESRAVFQRGPRFFRDDAGAVMFEISLDRKSRIGPRAMVTQDKHDYPSAWKAFETATLAEADPLKPIVSTEDHAQAKAAHEAAKAERQTAMDRKRAGGM